MMYRQGVLVAVLVAAVLAVGLPAAAAQETPANTPTNGSDAAGGLGPQLTAFAQSSSTAATETVDNAMWKSSFERANESQRARLVTNRAGTLEQRLDRLQARNETLRDRYENGSLPRAVYVAQQSRLAARIDGLQAAVNDTDAAASQANVSDDRIARLRQTASRLAGPQIAEIARGLGGGPPADRPGQGGPPVSAGPSSNETGPGDAGPRGDGETGPPGDAGAADQRGPPADNETAGQNDSGQSDRGNDSGQGQGDNSSGRGESGNGPGQGERGNGPAALDFVDALSSYLGSVSAMLD